MNFFDIKNFNLKILEIGFLEDISLMEHCKLIIEDLENISIENLKESSYYFVIEKDEI
jgi:hypothetical protein